MSLKSISVLGLFLLFSIVQAHAQCCSGYAFSREISVSNANSGSLNDFQFEFALNTQALVNSGKMRADGNDVYVVDGNCNPVPFWIEDNSFNTDRTNFWVKAPTLAASGTSSFFLVYGNPNATTANPLRDGDQTFVFFDDFNTGSVPDPAKWSFVNNTPSGNPSLTPSGYFTFTGSPGPNREIGLVHPMGAGDFEMGVRVFVVDRANAVDGDPGMGWFTNVIDRNQVVAGWNNHDEQPANQDVVWANGARTLFSANTTLNRWSFARLRLLGNQTQARHFGFSPAPAFDGSSSVQTVNASAITNLFLGSFAFQGNPVQYDFFFLRKATALEPTVSLQAEIAGPPLACGAPPVPTLSQWGLVVLSLLILNFAAVALWRRKRVLDASET